MRWNTKTNGEYRFARTGSYVDENGTDLTPERYEEILHVSDLMVVEFLKDQWENREVIPADDKWEKSHSKVLIEHKKNIKSDLLKRSKEGEFTIVEVAKITQNFSMKTRNLQYMFATTISDSEIIQCKNNLKKKYKEMIDF